jgi:hypothetical protein
MRGSRAGKAGGLLLAVAILGVGALGVLFAVSRTGAADVPRHGAGLRRLADTGVVVPVPDGWVDHRRAARGALLLEVEHRPLGGLVPLRGLWVGRSQPADPATELARLKSSVGGVARWADGPPVDGHPSVVHEEVIGPPLLHRLPAAVTMHRRVLRTVAHGRVYEVGFWGPEATLGDEVERRVLAGLRLEPPPPIVLEHAGVSITLPASWNRGDCKDSACAFSPFRGDRPNDSWVYVFDWQADSLDAGAERLVGSLSKQATVRDLVREPLQVAGRDAVRVRFAMAPKDTGPAQFEELLVPGRGERFVLVATGWRTPEGRSQLDSVMPTLRLYVPGP